MTNKITNISPTKKQNPISTSKLAEGDIKDLQNKILKKEQQQKRKAAVEILKNNEKKIQEICCKGNSNVEKNSTSNIRNEALNVAS